MPPHHWHVTTLAVIRVNTLDLIIIRISRCPHFAAGFEGRTVTRSLVRIDEVDQRCAGWIEMSIRGGRV